MQRGPRVSDSMAKDGQSGDLMRGRGGQTRFHPRVLYTGGDCPGLSPSVLADLRLREPGRWRDGQRFCCCCGERLAPRLRSLLSICGRGHCSWDPFPPGRLLLLVGDSPVARRVSGTAVTPTTRKGWLCLLGS